MVMESTSVARSQHPRNDLSALYVHFSMLSASNGTNICSRPLTCGVTVSMWRSESTQFHS